MLLNSPIPSLTIAQLGKDDYDATSETPGRVNASLYFTMAYLLAEGSRPNIPVCWAIARATEATLSTEEAPMTPARLRKIFGIVVDLLIDAKSDPKVVIDGKEFSITVLLSILASGRSFPGENAPPPEPPGDSCLMQLANHTRRPLPFKPTMERLVGIDLLFRPVWLVNRALGVVEECQSGILKGEDPEAVRKHGERECSYLLGPYFAHWFGMMDKALAEINDSDLSSMEDVWRCCQKAMFGAAFSYRESGRLPEPKRYSSNEERRDARLNSNGADSEVGKLRAECMDYSMRRFTDRMIRDMILPPDFSASERSRCISAVRNMIVDEVVSASKTVAAGDYRPVVFMSPESYEGFQKEGRLLNFWDLLSRGQETWHHRFSDAPELARAFNDHRLWGEKGDPLVHGAMLEWTEKGFVDPSVERLAEMYGSVAVVLNQSVLDYSSITMGDSQLNRFAMPATDPMLAKALFLGRVEAQEPSGNAPAGFSRAAQHLLFHSTVAKSFVEVQIHGHVHVGDVDDVIHVDVRSFTK